MEVRVQFSEDMGELSSELRKQNIVEVYTLKQIYLEAKGC